MSGVRSAAPSAALDLPLRFDRWLLAEGDVDRYLRVRRLLAAVLLVRLVTWRYHSLAELPDLLVHHVWYWRWTDGMPPASAMVAIQLVGIVGAVAVLLGYRANAGFGCAWAAFLLLAGLRGGLGKVLHNDALPLVAMVPFLVPGPSRASDPDAAARAGWPLRGAQLVVAAIYVTTGVQKLRHSGPEWVTSDNMRWIMEGGAASARVLPGVPAWIAEQPLVWRGAAISLIGMELLFPLVFVHPWLRRLLVSGAVAMHVMTLVTLELDYLGWAAVVLVLFVDWAAVGEWLRPERDRPGLDRASVGR